MSEISEAEVDTFLAMVRKRLLSAIRSSIDIDYDIDSIALGESRSVYYDGVTTITIRLFGDARW